MANKYRVIENITYVHDGKVVSVKGGLGKEVELTDEQAKALAGKVVRLNTPTDMFPDGGPLLDPVVATNKVTAEEHQVKPDKVVPVEPVKLKAERANHSRNDND